MAAPALAQPAARDAVARMTLVPVSPGGPPAGSPVYAVDAIPPVDFEIILNTDLGQLSIDDYLTLRSQQISAQFSVWLYRLDEATTATGGGQPGVQLVIEPDTNGNFPLDPGMFSPRATYGWQAGALIRDQEGNTVRLWSPMLHFRTAPAEASLPGLLTDPARSLAAELITICATQRRAQAALATRLRGLHLYGNYPSASDIFFCTSLTMDESIPYLPVDSGGEPDLALIIALGRIMADVDQLKRLAPETVAKTDLTGISTRIYELVSQEPELTVLPIGRRLSTLAAVAEKLSDPPLDDPQGISSLLNELLLAIDSVVAGGTTELNAGYTQLFAVYFLRVDGIIDRLVELQPQLEQALGAEEAAYWLEYFTDQQAQLAEMAEEVRLDRLSKALLMDQIAENRWGIMEAGADAFRYLEGTACRVEADRIKRLTAADTAQVERLQAEIIRCHLLRLADYLWPEIR